MEQTQTILIVDGDPRICRLLQRYLENEGYEIHTASSIKAMRQKLVEVKVHLILLDIRLPDEDVFTLAKELRSLSNLSIIMVMEESDPRDNVLGLKLGADDYLSKPFDERELLDRVHSVFRRLSQKRSQSDV
jgi:two-component system phosphate regulon response regulator OmpR